MRNLLVLATILFLSSCEDDFSKEKYDVSFYFENQTNQNLSLSVFETNNVKSWEDIPIEPNGSFNFRFNIKKDIGAAEGGFIIQAILAKGDTLSLNTGYYTNYQFQGESQANFSISSSEIKLLSSE
ncbi:hypothetical protein [Arcticibacterium luteifluviistationis]|uniref:Uncharacterized protein n=1 Tax=Arcticibacterium luteifluviistationis TaxID=1784714 RepID=A0A2Z4GAZ1_9BACT|nr:hypothetical protein [Arcticibacterium luteifluviistationis]AWV98291.1 hypothetical protein DJ013_08955 [Arcticibacterium luteifluviistationis]